MLREITAVYYGNNMEASNTDFLVLYLTVYERSIMLGSKMFLFEELILSIQQSVFFNNHRRHKLP
jgi:hypothetical protein